MGPAQRSRISRRKLKQQTIMKYFSSCRFENQLVTFVDITAGAPSALPPRPWTLGLAPSALPCSPKPQSPIMLRLQATVSTVASVSKRVLQPATAQSFRLPYSQLAPSRTPPEYRPRSPHHRVRGQFRPGLHCQRARPPDPLTPPISNVNSPALAATSALPSSLQRIMTAIDEHKTPFPDCFKGLPGDHCTPLGKN